MKKRFLKNYEDYKSDMTNENSLYKYRFGSYQTVSEEEEEIKKDEDKSVDKDKTEEEDDSKKDDKKSKSKSDDKKDDKKSKSKTKTKKKVEEDEEDSEEIALNNKQSEEEEDTTDEIPDVSDAVDINDNGVQDITNSFNPLESSAREFSVVKIMTKNGVKVMMCYTCDADEYDSISDNIDFRSACSMVEDESSKLGLEKFDRNKDVNLGAIPSFMVDRKIVDNSTSYRPR
jgi:hypothetical protein